MPPQLQHRDINHPIIRRDEQNCYYYGVMRFEPRLAGDPFFLVQLDIRIDRHYARQSYAQAKLWSVPQMQWVELTHLLPQQIAECSPKEALSGPAREGEWTVAVAHKLLTDASRVVASIRGEKIYA